MRRPPLGIVAGLATGPLAFALTQLVSPAWVEAHYVQELGQPVASALGAVNATVGFSIAEAAVYTGVGLGLLWIRRRAQRPGWFGAVALGLAVAASALYALFVGMWGLDYRREPLLGRFGFPSGRPTTAEVEQLAREQVRAAGAAREKVAEDESGVASLFGYDPFPRVATAYDRAAGRWPWIGGVYGPAKPVAASVLLSYAGLGGVYCPFTGEPNVNVDQPEFDLPFSIAHETAHQRGVAREDEANFVGWLVLRDFGDPTSRYSALLDGAYYAVSAWARVDPQGASALWASATPAMKRDIAADEAWRDRYQTPFVDLFAGVNSAYLKSNGVKDGIESYGRMVDLMVAERRAMPPAP